MGETLASMYITLLPAILAGILTMIWCRLPIFSSLKRPMDAGKNWRDGKRIFGDNKTWQGFAGYLILNAMAAVLWGALARRNGFLAEHNYFYRLYSNTIGYNLRIGVLLGLGYALFELPNSFVKRRLDISAGKTAEGMKRFFFVFMDQADSVIGCTLVVLLHSDIGIRMFLAFILVGAGTHIILNILLYAAGLRKNMF